MRTSSRPAHRKIRRSTLEIRQEKWKRAAGPTILGGDRQIIDNDGVVIPAGTAAPDFVAFDVQDGFLVGSDGIVYPTREAALAASMKRVAPSPPIPMAKPVGIRAGAEPSPPHSATYGPGNWESFFPHLLLMGLFILGCVGGILAIGKVIDVFTSH